MNQSEMSLSVPEVKGVVESFPGKPAEVRLRKPIRNQVEMILRDLSALGLCHGGWCRECEAA